MELLFKFLSTPSARRATFQSYDRHECLYISIHALREEGDRRYPPLQTRGSAFLSTPSARRATALVSNANHGHIISIHALREEGDSGSAASKTTRKTFLSTPSARRATRVDSLSVLGSLFLSTPSARRATPHRTAYLVRRSISIHALREEGDWYALKSSGAWPIFLSTPSARRATPFLVVPFQLNLHFYPRPPRGGRQIFKVCWFPSV